ncbi:zinc ribbon domain-containing protein [Reticulibacter mediterranei]|nr:zinc ribbon domain-containing protein [Reticulibacter mediterranei]
MAIPNSCTQCGAELLSTANFCHVCGTRRLGSAGTLKPDNANFCHVCGIRITANATESVWEHCQIEYELVGALGFSHRFIAKALGPRGPYMATDPSVTISTNFPHPGVKKDVQACDTMKARLLADRWEPLAEQGPEWFNYKFRRRVL